jgi:cytoskeletal protein CcmA (bactofilin family)
MDVVSSASSFSGNFKFTKYVRIEGTMEGTISSEGILVSGERSNIKAELEGCIVIISGKFSGNITASKLISLEPGSIVNAEINAPNIEIKDGAIINGNILMNKYHSNELKRLESF